jgi:hypothetical protein
VRDRAAKARRPHDEAFCSWIEARIRKSDEPQLARVAEIRALEATARANNPRTDAYTAGQHMRYSWSTKPHDIAVRDSLTAIDTLETLRALQEDADSSAALFSGWTQDYYWLSGRLLQGRSRRGRCARLLDHRTDAGALAARRG